MRRILILVFMVVTLSGCALSNDLQHEYLQAMKDEGYIGEDWGVFDTFTTSSADLVSDHVYYYKDPSEIYHEVILSVARTHDDEGKYYRKVKVYSGMECDIGRDGDESKFFLRKPDDLEAKEYHLYRKKFLFWSNIDIKVVE